MKRQRSNAVDLNSLSPNIEERRLKTYIYATSGMYLNFAYDSFVMHNALDRTRIREHVSGFAQNVANGKAKEALIKYLGLYLEPRDFASMRLVCKPQI